MINVRSAALVALAFALGGDTVAAQAPFQYRDHAFGSNVAAIVATTAGRASDVRVRHERPARIEDLEWRAPYVAAGAESPDPVRDVLFSFYDNQLYQVVVTYDRDRIAGLTNADIIEALSATYGVPLLASARTVRSPLSSDNANDAVVVARWEDASAMVTLIRGNYPEIQLLLVSKTLHPQARAAMKEAVRLDEQDAPRREADLRKKEAADLHAASQKARLANKAAFKP